MPPISWTRLRFALVASFSLTALATSQAVAYGRDLTVSIQTNAVRVTVDAQRGRIVEFQPTGSDNRLWLNDADSMEAERAQAGYSNWGGDKVWTAPQPLWRYSVGRIWPPDSATDGTAAEIAERTAASVTIRFPISESFGTRLTREISVDTETASLRIRNRLEQHVASPFPAQVWSITQVPLPDRVLFDASAKVGDAAVVNLNALRTKPPLGPIPFEDGTVSVGDGWAVFRPGKHQQKIGAMGTWIAGVWPDGIFLQESAYDSDGMYPEASSLQFYSGDRYGELETLSAARHLRPGEAIEWTVTWQWIPGPTRGVIDVDLVKRIQAAISAAGAREKN